MKALQSLLVALIVVISSTFVDASLEVTCRRATSPPALPTYNFCVTTLQAVPGSRNADVQGLAIMATKLASATYRRNLARARELFNSNLPANAKKPLGDCVQLYDSSVSRIDEALAHIRSHDIFSAKLKLGAVESCAVDCIDSWKESKQKPLMLKENDDARQISSLALAITSLLK